MDCTAGGAGHSRLIVEQLNQGRLLALDRDPFAVATARGVLSAYPQATIVQRRFSELNAILTEFSLPAPDGVLIDAGVSSFQIDQGARGFSFQADGPLDMRMDQSEGETAAELAARLTPEELQQILRELGDVGPAGRIAKRISERARSGRLTTTSDLADAVQEALPHVQDTPSETRTVFQALRMAVNDELGELARGVDAALDALAPSGRLVVITFHSGEDRLVKKVMREASRPRRELHPDGRTKKVTPPRARVLTPKPIVPDAMEVMRNRRSKSARMRVAERVRIGDE